MERVLKIEAFRNMGFKDGKPEATELLLNESAVKGHLGNLLTVVGTNGAGKTNVLNALTTYSSGKFAERDVTNLYFEDECQNPKLTYSYKDNENEWSCSKGNNEATEIKFPNMEKPDLSKERAEYLFEDIEVLCQLEDECLSYKDPYYPERKNYIRNDFHNLRGQLDAKVKKLLKDADEDKLKKIEEAKVEFKTILDKAATSFLERANYVKNELREGKYEYNAFVIGQKVKAYSKDEADKMYADCCKSFESKKERSYREYMSELNALVQFSDDECDSYTDWISNILAKYKNAANNRYEENKEKFSEFIFAMNNNPVSRRYIETSNTEFQKLTSAFKNQFGFSFNNRISVYKQEHITSEMFNTDCNVPESKDGSRSYVRIGDRAYYENIALSPFYRSLFHSIDVGVDSVINAYRNYKTSKTKGFLSKLEDELNEKLKDVAEKFSRMYFSGKTPYSFEIELERGGIFLTIYRAGKPQVLDLQSTGFRYFFDMFFNLLNTTELKAGDIIIMDEPATNLHVKGQRELRDFLKRFAINNDITIIVATHSPFMIDTDNLDDVRVVVSDGEVSRIENNFAAVDPTDPDSLLPIKEALTVENYMLVNPKEKVVFVPTMEDYCYLVAFKKLFKIQGISFLPVNGISEDAESCKTVAKRLMQIRSDAFILVNDDEAGKCMKDVCKDSDFTVFTLSEVDERFSTIPALFAEGDKPADSASTFKNYLDTYTVNDESRANFKKLFDYFVEEAY